MTEQLIVTESEQALIKARDEVLRKIGRNLVNFQKIEQLLKGVILSSRMSGYVSELENYHKQKSEEIHTQTMGLIMVALEITTWYAQHPSSYCRMQMLRVY